VSIGPAIRAASSRSLAAGYLDQCLIAAGIIADREGLQGAIDANTRNS
jgi:hypothetical protein